MTMNYNKWGVVTGIVGLVLLLGSFTITLYIGPWQYYQKYSWTLPLRGLLFLSSIPPGLLTSILGIFSIWKGNKKKTALILGIIYILLLPIILILMSSVISYF